MCVCRRIAEASIHAYMRTYINVVSARMYVCIYACIGF